MDLASNNLGILNLFVNCKWNEMLGTQRSIYIYPTRTNRKYILWKKHVLIMKFHF